MSKKNKKKDVNAAPATTTNTTTTNTTIETTTAMAAPVKAETKVEAKATATTVTTAAPPRMEMKPATDAAPKKGITREELEQLVRTEAYRRAEARNFRNGSPVQDWLSAEAAVAARLAAEGRALPQLRA